MERHIARFASLRPQKAEYEKRGIAPGAFELIAAKTIYNLLAPAGERGTTAGAAIQGEPGLLVGIAKCPPGNGPLLHAHMRTCENFMALTGRWEVRWGDQAQHCTFLKPFDF